MRMPHPPPDAPRVLCLHGSASSTRQWAPLAERLAGSHRVLAADLCGYGASRALPDPGTHSLDREVTHLAPLLDAAGEPLDVVGHSYGAALALHLAMVRPQSVRSLYLYEPVSFGMLFEALAGGRAAAEVRALIAALWRTLEAGDAAAAARHFVDYWSGAGSFRLLPAARRERLAAQMHTVMANFTAASTGARPLGACAAVAAPVRLAFGTRSPRSTRAISALLQQALPHVAQRAFDGLGHMGPVTHPEVVNADVGAFLGGARQAPPLRAVA